MVDKINLENIKLSLLAIIVSISISSLSLFGTHSYLLIALTVTIVLIMSMIYPRLKEGMILTITIICAFTPEIASLGFKISTINISVTDCVILLNYFYLIVTLKTRKIQIQCKEYGEILSIFVCMAVLLFLSFGWSIYYNDFGLALKLVRTSMYSFFIYLLFIASYKEDNITGYMMFLSTITSIVIIFTYQNIVKNTGEYSLFRNSETFTVSVFCYLTIIFTFTKLTYLKKIFALVGMISLIGAIVVQQDRVQIVAVVVSLSSTILFLLIKGKLSIRKITKITFCILLVLAFICLVIKLIDNEGINNMFQSYYTNRIAILLNGNGNLQLDASLSFRQLEYQDIIQTITSSLGVLILGKGLGATYLGGLTVVDSFWFWILLNLGLIGLMFFAYVFFFIFKVLVNDKTPIKSAPIFAYFCATCIMTITTPNMIYRVDDSVSMGILLGLIHLTLKNNPQNTNEKEFGVDKMPISKFSANNT